MIFHIHKLSRVFTIDKRTYQVCLDCGEKLELTSEAKEAWNCNGKNNLRSGVEPQVCGR